MNITAYLENIIKDKGIDKKEIQLPQLEIEPCKIKVIMINEVPPENNKDWFYSSSEDPAYMRTTRGLFKDAGVNVSSMRDIIELGIYITTAVKTPKKEYTVKTEVIKEHLPILKAEMSLFPNLKVIMLMGDVGKKAFNMIYKSQNKKNLIPSESTYKIRGNEYYWGEIRVFPSYIMTGGNILIEKSKREMVSEDISKMIQLI